VPVAVCVDVGAGLVARVVLRRRDDDGDLLCRVVELLQVVDRLVPVVVVLRGDAGTVVEAGLFLQHPEDRLDVVGPDDEPSALTWTFAVED